MAVDGGSCQSGMTCSAGHLLLCWGVLQPRARMPSVPFKDGVGRALVLPKSSLTCLCLSCSSLCGSLVSHPLKLTLPSSPSFPSVTVHPYQMPLASPLAFWYHRFSLCPAFVTTGAIYNFPDLDTLVGLCAILIPI